MPKFVPNFYRRAGLVCIAAGAPRIEFVFREIGGFVWLQITLIVVFFANAVVGVGSLMALVPRKRSIALSIFSRALRRQYCHRHSCHSGGLFEKVRDRIAAWG